MCSPLRQIPAIWTLLSLLSMAPAAAHEDHAHVFTGIPLWQIAAGRAPGRGGLFHVDGLAEAT